MQKDKEQTHHWKFFRTGGLDQVSLERGADLLALEHLDQKLWVALSCPTKGLEFDCRTLELIDTDKDGRIRAPELIAAIKWAASLLKNPDALVSGKPRLALSDINDSTPQGKMILSSARQVLNILGKGDQQDIGVEDTSDQGRIFKQALLNGDGVVPVDTAQDEETKKLLQDILSTVGGVEDRSGVVGVNQAKLNEFFTLLQSYADWWAQGEKNSTEGEGVLPLGDKTPAGYDLFAKVKGKIDDFFNRVRLSSFDQRSVAFLNRSEQQYATWSEQNLATLPADILDLPLSRIEADRNLPLTSELNPAWAASIEEFRTSIVNPLLGDDVDELSPENWALIRDRFAAFSKWRTSKQGDLVEKLGIERIRQILQSEYKKQIESLIKEDLSVAAQVDSMDELDKLVRYHRDLHRLSNNFVSFSDFFAKDRWAVFQAGTLLLDSRACSLCIKVADPNAHSVMAQLSRCYIAYCECRRVGHEPMKIAAIFSDGDSDNLMVGRNGIFYDREGRDWDATIVKLLENPISIRQAFWLPYKKFVRFIDEQVTKRAAAADEAASQKLAAMAETAANADKAAPATPAAPTPAPKKMDVGTVAALGVALGSIGTFVTMILTRVIDLGYWMPLALIGLMLLISGPSMFLAWIKLRQRTLGSILDANGWAINGRIFINLPLAKSLTDVKALPKGSSRSLVDPFLDKAARRRKIISITLVVLVLLSIAGYYAYDYFEKRREAAEAQAQEQAAIEAAAQTATGQTAPEQAPAVAP